MKVKGSFRFKVMLGLMLLLVVALCLPPAVHAQQIIHVVRPGENLTQIAARYGSTVQAIVRANGIRNPNLIWVGQRLVIPTGGGGGGGGWPVGRCRAVHYVRWGETLSQIAWHYGTTVWAIAAANGLRNPNYIWAGQRLCIPYGGGYHPRPCGVVHVVRWGETLSSIAHHYGTCVQAIARANCLRNPNYIWAGQRLYIPCQ